MKASAKLICLLAWVLAAVVQSIFVASVPDKIVISGVDISHANHMVLVHQALFIGFGFALAAAAYFAKRWTFVFVVASSALYLVHWFPFQSIKKYGLVAVSKGMMVVGSNPGLRLTFVTRDIILPIAFVVAIAFVALAIHRQTPSAVQT
jgi:hypothetical protein